MEDKILRMIDNELEMPHNNELEIPKTGFQNGFVCDTMNVPQMSRPA